VDLRISVLGCGRWGSFHLWHAAMLGYRPTGWEPAGSRVLEMLSRDRSNEYLSLPEGVVLTTDLSEALEADVLLVSVPSQEWRGLSSTIASSDLGSTDLLLCMKGLEKGTGARMSEIALQTGIRARSVSAWLGPGHPQELVSGVPTCMLIASSRDEDASRLAGLFGSGLIRFYRSTDLAGCEIGAAAKNVVGIAAGMLDGLGFCGLKGALMARAPQEMARVASAAGGDWRSVYGLSHLGDYEATLFSRLSRNRAFGEALVRGLRPDGLAEGVETAGALELLAQGLGVEVPITSAVEAVILGEYGAREAIDKLFGRPSREEFSPLDRKGGAP
jgi:glycerol-3-phosphate dehydrogenase (NAD(P)+)